MPPVIAPMKEMEIWEIEIPELDDGGHEQTGRHPAIVLAVHIETTLATIIPLTSQTTEANNFPHTHYVARSQANRLDRDSVALIFQIKSIDFMRFRQKIGFMEQTEYYTVTKKLRLFLKV